MNDLAPSSVTDIDLSFSTRKGKWEVAVAKWDAGAAYNARDPIIDKSVRGTFWNFGTITMALLLSQQANPALDIQTEYFQTLVKVAAEIERLNYSPALYRFLITPIDLNSIGVSEQPKSPSSDKAELETIFNGLVKKWRDETRWSSITMRRYAHSSYQAILVLGGKEPTEVTKLILKQMQKNPDMWFEALRRLNNSIDDPAKNSKSFEEATNAWLAWGRVSGLIS